MGNNSILTSWIQKHYIAVILLEICAGAKEGSNTGRKMLQSLHQKCEIFSAPERLPLGPVRTGLPVNLCTHLTFSSPKKCKTSHLKRLYCDY